MKYWIGFKLKIKKHLSRLSNRVLGNAFTWKMSQFYGIESMNYEEAIWREKGKQGFIRSYEENLKIVMTYTKQLIVHLPPGRVVITADHGELLGEGNFFGHSKHIPRCSIILDVPWLEIKRQ